MDNQPTSIGMADWPRVSVGTSAMAAGVTEHLWEIEDIVALLD